MATYDYKGTKITGTDATSKKFKKSGITKARVNDTYLNTSTGHVYKCTTAGNASTAEWRYDRTAIIGVPNVGYSKLSTPVRESGNRRMTATWKVPDKLTDEKNGRRATYLKTYWSLGIAGKDPKDVDKDSDESMTTDTVNLDNFKVGNKTYTRQSFYPNTDTKLSYVTFKVVPFNSKGKGSVEAKQTRNFDTPRKPSLGTFNFDSSTGRVSIVITTDAGADYKERYDTKYSVKVYNSPTQKTTTPTDSSSTSTSITAGYNASGYQGLYYQQYIKVTVSAYARGYAGKSDTVTDTCYISAPTEASMGNIEAKTERCIVPITITKDEKHPVTGVRLQYVNNCTYQKASDIPSDEWQDYNVSDDGKCKALTIDKATIYPDAGKYTWLRVKTWNWDENIPSLVRYSEPKRVTDYERKEQTAEDDVVKIISAVAGKNGTSVKLIVGWNPSGTETATGTELTWSTDEDAWKSTKEPQEYSFTWTDGRYPATGTRQFYDHATITIKDLEPSTKYYIHARRYQEGESRTTYSNPAIATCTTSTVSTDSDELVETVAASCDGIVPRDGSLQVYWAFSSTKVQKSWQIISTNGNKVIEKGNGSIGATQISASRLEAVAVNGVASFRVYASSGSDPAVSGTLSVNIVDKPTLSLTVGATLTAQPFNFTATASTPCDLVVKVSSQGAVGQTPTGMRRQAHGDTIHSDVYSPVWTSSNETLTTTITLPTGLDLWDLGTYTLSVTAIDRLTGLKSDVSEKSFAVNWARKAPSPADAVTITPVDEVDDDGYHIRGADIALTPPIGSDPSDFYEIYRLTGDGAVLIGESFPLTYTVRDLYAPFSEDGTCYYRIAVRTVDGDTEFADIEYIADTDGRFLRFDWADGFLELPYGLTMADSYTKTVAFRQHMDGGTDGYWNTNIERKSSFNTAVIKILQPSEIETVRKLARFAGAVFVRTSEGTAYLADVQVTDLSKKNEAVMLVAFDVTEIDLTEEYMLPTPYQKQDEEE